jgi:GNAT superfamily N-acetyltransferase
MHINVEKASPDTVTPWRELYRQELNCQIIHDSWHGRGWTDSYLMRVQGRVVGYGLVGGVRGAPKDTVTEYYVLPPHRAAALALFRRLVEVSHARLMECQSNDILMTLMLYDCATKIESNVVLFHDAMTTKLAVKDGAFRCATADEKGSVFTHNHEPVGDWVIAVGNEIVATGGVLYHYNPPYGDIYMEVAEPHRRRGYGSYLVQELKRVSYELGKIPAARCNAANVSSRATLQRAGLLPCARLLKGALVSTAATN